jgi:hypothetical protein
MVESVMSFSFERQSVLPLFDVNWTALRRELSVIDSFT